MKLIKVKISYGRLKLEKIEIISIFTLLPTSTYFNQFQPTLTYHIKTNPTSTHRYQFQSILPIYQLPFTNKTNRPLVYTFRSQLASYPYVYACLRIFSCVFARRLGLHAPGLKRRSSVFISHRRFDGDQPIKDPKEAKEVKEVQEAAKDAKEVQLMMRNALALPDSLSASSSRTWPGFVWLVELDPGELISCMHASVQA